MPDRAMQTMPAPLRLTENTMNASSTLPEPPATPVKLPPYERVCLLLQGGGALGAYHAGVYQGLLEADIRLTDVSGISIGALNNAIIAGHPPDKRIARRT